MDKESIANLESVINSVAKNEKTSVRRIFMF